MFSCLAALASRSNPRFNYIPYTGYYCHRKLRNNRPKLWSQPSFVLVRVSAGLRGLADPGWLWLALAPSPRWAPGLSLPGWWVSGLSFSCSGGNTRAVWRETRDSSQILGSDWHSVTSAHFPPATSHKAQLGWKDTLASGRETALTRGLARTWGGAKACVMTQIPSVGILSLAPPLTGLILRVCH